MSPESISEVLERAHDLLSAGRPGAALRVLRSLGDEYLEEEDRIEYTALQALALSDSGRGDRAVDLLDALLEEFPDSARLHSTAGIVLAAAGEFEDACDELEEAHDLDPGDASTLANLAMVYEELREYDRAAKLYARAAEKGGDLQWILPRQAAVYTEMNLTTRACKTLRRYLSIVPDDAEQWIALAILCSDDGDFHAAGDCYRHAERLDGDSATLRLNWGVTAVRAHDTDEAERQRAHLAALEPDAARTFLLEAYILEERGELVAAEAAYERALQVCVDENDEEQTYTLEMAMDFFARQQRAGVCDKLLAAAYRINACTVELCEAHRQVHAAACEAPRWFSVMLEADHRAGLSEMRALDAESAELPRRYLRNFQVVARDRDEAVSMAIETAQQFGETNVIVREFAGEEALEGAYGGLYEIARDAFVVPQSELDA